MRSNGAIQVNELIGVVFGNERTLSMSLSSSWKPPRGSIISTTDIGDCNKIEYERRRTLSESRSEMKTSSRAIFLIRFYIGMTFIFEGIQKFLFPESLDSFEIGYRPPLLLGFLMR